MFTVLKHEKTLSMAQNSRPKLIKKSHRKSTTQASPEQPTVEQVEHQLKRGQIVRLGDVVAYREGAHYVIQEWTADGWEDYLDEFTSTEAAQKLVSLASITSSDREATRNAISAAISERARQVARARERALQTLRSASSDDLESARKKVCVYVAACKSVGIQPEPLRYVLREALEVELADKRNPPPAGVNEYDRRTARNYGLLFARILNECV